MLEEHQILISLQAMDLEVWEANLVEEQARGLHSFDGRDISAELEKFSTRVDGVEDEHATEVRKLSTLVVGIPIALVNRMMLPIWVIPQLSKLVSEVLVVVGLILECMQEELASDAGPWE
jgi:hypothetical protein